MASTTVYVRTESKSDMDGTVGWTDVYLKQGNGSPLNVSRCDGINCGKPSLSNDGRQAGLAKGGRLNDVGEKASALLALYCRRNRAGSISHRPTS